MIDQAVNKKEQEQEHFIAVTVKDLVSKLSTDTGLLENQVQPFKQFCKIYIALYHAKFFSRLQLLKETYLPFSPDRVTLPFNQYSPIELKNLQHKLIEEIQAIIEKANYISISKDELNRALSETSPYGLNVSIEFDDFDEIHLYYRGLFFKTEEKKTWRTFYLKSEIIKVPIYRRLFLVLKLNENHSSKEPTCFRKNPKKYVLEKWRHLFRFKVTQGDGGSFLYLKLFKDIPRSDLEMLFPNARVEMKQVDKLTMGVSGGGGFVGGIIAVIAKIARAAHPGAILFAVAGFGGIIWREINKVISNRNRYMAILAKSLYFHNLDNNVGVLANLIEMAEAEECKESILAYAFILSMGEKGCTKEQLDQMVENYLSESFGIQIDFELGDGINKLERDGLLEYKNENVLTVCSIEKAIEHLDMEWDQLF